MLAVALAYLWMLSLGAMVWMAGNAKWVDRTDRSLFTLGCQWLNRVLKLGQPIFVSFRPYPFVRGLPTSGVG
jgi:hypothetical protein